MDIPSIAIRGNSPGTGGKIYLNSAAIGKPAPSVLEGTLSFMRTLSEEGDQAIFDNPELLASGPRECFAYLYGCDERDIFLGGSISEVLCNIAFSMRPGLGQNVVCVDVDIPAVSYPWLRVAHETGLEVRFVKVSDDPAPLHEKMLLDLVDERTAAISVSHVEWTTGHMFDLKVLADAVHSVGGRLIVDGMHSSAVMPLDVPASGADVFVAGSYKWLGAYSGVAGCFIAPDMSQRLHPILVGANTSVPNPPHGFVDASHLDYPEDNSKFNFGSQSHPSKVAVTYAAENIKKMGLQNIAEHNFALFHRLAEGLSSLGAEIITPTEEGRHAAVLSARFPGHESHRIMEDLAGQGIVVSTRMNALRFSPHYHNTSDEVDKVLDALGQYTKK